MVDGLPNVVGVDVVDVVDVVGVVNVVGGLLNVDGAAKRTSQGRPCIAANILSNAR